MDDDKTFFAKMRDALTTSFENGFAAGFGVFLYVTSFCVLSWAIGHDFSDGIILSLLLSLWAFPAFLVLYIGGIIFLVLFLGLCDLLLIAYRRATARFGVGINYNL